MTIFLTTQYLEEADELADQIAIIDQGRIRTQGSPAKLKASVGSEAINLAFEDQSAAQRAHELFGDLNGNNQVDRDTLRLYMSNAAEAIPEVLRRLEPIDLTPISITLTQPTLDDVFLQVTGQSFQAEENETVIE
jgi:ABC-2 type transport system ATP-binding protein